MCGITGLIYQNKSPNINFDIILKTIKHRGPDDQGYYQGPNFMIGNTRLSIVDLSHNGKQPIFSYNNRYVIVLNGEIYNYKELKSNYLNDIEFNSDTDTEVVVNLIAKLGMNVETIQLLEGMFSIAIYDFKLEKLYLIRDRLGIKPLYYSITNNIIAFGSEIKTIHNILDQKFELNTVAILSYLQFRYPVGNATFYKKINKLPNGSIYEIDKSLNIKKKIYWSLDPSMKRDINVEEAKTHISKFLYQAVKKRLIADVPLGAFLSGGLDSTIIVHIMASIIKNPIKTYSISIKGDPFSEFKYAKLVSKKYKTDHTQIEVDLSNYFELLEEMIFYRDEPLGVPNEPLIMKLSEELKKNITVVLSGEGADELFGGYGRIFNSADDFDKINSTPSQDFKNRFAEKYGDIDLKNPSSLFLHNYRYTSLKVLKEILNENFFNNNINESISPFLTIFDKVKKHKTKDQFLYIFQTLHLPNLLNRLDATTMSKSVEARVPFVDYKLVDYVNSLSNKLKIKINIDEDNYLQDDELGGKKSEIIDTTKFVLRDIFKDELPTEIINRKKVGFPIPLSDWFHENKLNNIISKINQGPLMQLNILDYTKFNNWISQSKNNQSEKSGMIIWMLYNLHLWMKNNNYLSI